uniref:Defensin n=1 Tax=Panagrolaimus sp. JU765 TaxID=591449 RepID=A0AC34PXR0_9BILA
MKLNLVLLSILLLGVIPKTDAAVSSCDLMNSMFGWMSHKLCDTECRVMGHDSGDCEYRQNQWVCVCS